MMIHVHDVRAGLDWYSQIFEANEAFCQLESKGVILYRGPMNIENNLWQAQFRDPWGNCIGIRGPK